MRNNELFTPTGIDEQIEELAQAHHTSVQQTSPNGSIVHDLYQVYQEMNDPEQLNRSLERIWERLEEHTSATAITEAPMETPGRVIPLRTGADEQQEWPRTVSQQVKPRSSWRRTLALSIAVAVVLLNILGWSLLARSMHHTPPLGHVGTPTAAAHPTALKIQANQLLQEFEQEVTSWGEAHQYHDAYDGKSYALDYSYDQQGIGQDAQNAVHNAHTDADYQAAIDLLNNDMAHLRAMEADYSDKTPWKEAHATDMQLLQRYHLMAGRVIVVSLVEQSLRVYQHGKLVKAFLVTTGRFERPTPPGLWHILYRTSPTILKASVPPDSPYWFPDTPVNYAMEFRAGCFINDSWWRAFYGPGTELPSYAGSNVSAFSRDGSTGNIEMGENDAAWLYHNTGMGDSVIVY